MYMCTNGRDYSRSGRVVIDDEHIIAYSLPCPNCGFKVDRYHFNVDHVLRCPFCGCEFVDETEPGKIETERRGAAL